MGPSSAKGCGEANTVVGYTEAESICTASLPFPSPAISSPDVVVGEFGNLWLSVSVFNPSLPLLSSASSLSFVKNGYDCLLTGEKYNRPG